MAVAEPRLSGFLDDCLHEASALALAIRGRSAETKAGDRNQVVTDADRRIGALLVGRIRDEFPDATVIEEESGVVTGTGDQVWIVDPVDGTSNYVAGSPLYGTMLALVEHGRPVAAGVALPAFGHWYSAEAGHGLRSCGQPVEPAAPGRLADSLVAYGLDVGSPAQTRADWRLLESLTRCVRGVRMSNSVFDAVMVATGVYGAFVHRRMRIWDVAPIDALVTAAGGACTDLAGRLLDWTCPVDRVDETFAVCVTAPGLAQPLREIIAWKES
ncbi:inositol monophosphatase family protein [Kutzneria sp. NPDC052558]|uniref:inositol monophosphatase family protein n=1 Tax=Kutzneria sp. NPDC052558 TaxID=3364121 RepID=UPI0037CAF208